MSLDVYRILEPWGQDLEPQAHWLYSQPATAEIWVTYKLTDGTELALARPLSALERSAMEVLLSRARVHGPEVGIQLAQGYDTGEAEPHWATLGDIAEIVIEVRT
jgi:hypothetical protein